MRMTKEELSNSLAFINFPDGELCINLYACLANNSIKLLDVNNDDLPPIMEMFKMSLNRLVINNEYSIVDLSSADERANCIYLYDLQLPNELEVLNSVINNDDIERLNLNKDSFTEIKSLAILLADNSHEIVLYKKMFPIEIIGKRGYLLWKANDQFKRFAGQLLRISDNFHVMKVDRQFFILDLQTIERAFGFYEVIKKEALSNLQRIKDIDIISNVEVLDELADDVTFARKLTKVAKNSPIIKHNIPNENIVRFSQTHPALRNKLRYDSGKFVLDTKVSKNLFIKLLNDDFLTSELTRLYYDSIAKDNIQE